MATDVLLLQYKTLATSITPLYLIQYSDKHISGNDAFYALYTLNYNSKICCMAYGWCTNANDFSEKRYHATITSTLPTTPILIFNTPMSFTFNYYIFGY